MKWLEREAWQGPFDDLTELHLGTACDEAGIALEEPGKTIDERHATVLWGCVFEDFLAAELDDGSAALLAYSRQSG